MPTLIKQSLAKKLIAPNIARALASAIVLFSGCTSSETVMSEKMDAPLRQQLERAEASEPVSAVSVFVRCNRPITESEAALMRATGSVIGSIAGNICTARGLPPQIKELARLDFVMKLELETQNIPSINP